MVAEGVETQFALLNESAVMQFKAIILASPISAEEVEENVLEWESFKESVFQ